MKRVAVIMAGGGGTRFWPISRMSCPKQLVKLTSDEPMINETINHFKNVVSVEDTFIVTNKEQALLMKTLLPTKFNHDQILQEPVGRNTAPCILYAAMRIHKQYGDTLMAVLPADHHISDVKEYERILDLAYQTAEEQDKIVTIGLWPTFASSGYGYIRFGEPLNGSKEVFALSRFVEKPDTARAQEYIQSRKYLWNSGMFVWKTSTILKAFETYMPDLYTQFCSVEQQLGTAEEETAIATLYPTLQSISVDYGIMEKAKNVSVISAEFGWNDVGTWDALAEVFPKDDDDNVVRAPYVGVDTENCIVFSKSGKRVITTVGVSDLVIVDTDDAIMVCHRDSVQDVKKLVEELKQQNRIDLVN
ncbi:MAG TPA: mannose-1-phosphate guanylyltransferase [Bacillota bacterium]|nr:mannose-1-phosphate guanylyltransferase [Bacillota bacterium]HPE38384.1 mannose-1-phosphate guanylyltransferase [Bacillota bacterium]